MISIEEAIVEKISWEREGIQCLEVTLAGKAGKEKALNYPKLTGKISAGQRVFLNTTAVRLGLGSGGYHFVLFNPARGNIPFSPQGHIIKLRYTPFQLKVHTYEEKLSEICPDILLKKYRGLGNTPVVIGELHSMIAPFVLLFNKRYSGKRIVYIMTDSASLPLYLSDTVSRLKAEGMLAGTITCGHAFGGDIETVNVYTALTAAKEELKADVILLVPGPGVVGTGTRYGFSGIEQGEHIDRVNKFKGIPVFIPRISFADKRSRHYGLSHHSITALAEISSSRAYLPFPLLNKKKRHVLFRQLIKSGLPQKHRLVLVKKLPLKMNITFPGIHTMGRSIQEDPDFFAAVEAAAVFTGKLFSKI